MCCKYNVLPVQCVLHADVGTAIATCLVGHCTRHWDRYAYLDKRAGYININEPLSESEFGVESVGRIWPSRFGRCRRLSAGLGLAFEWPVTHRLGSFGFPAEPMSDWVDGRVIFVWKRRVRESAALPLSACHSCRTARRSHVNQVIDASTHFLSVGPHNLPMSPSVRGQWPTGAPLVNVPSVCWLTRRILHCTLIEYFPFN